MRHDLESCDQGGEDQDKTWLDGPVTSVKGKLEALVWQNLLNYRAHMHLSLPNDL